MGAQAGLCFESFELAHMARRQLIHNSKALYSADTRWHPLNSCPSTTAQGHACMPCARDRTCCALTCQVLLCVVHGAQVHSLAGAAHTGVGRGPDQGQGQGGDTAGVQAALGSVQQSAAAEQLAGDPWGQVCPSMGYPAEQKGVLGS